jgi:hypothetical protein
MSLIRAFEIIRPIVPLAIAQKVEEKLQSAGEQKDLSIEYFSLWPIRDPKYHRFVYERRLIGCENIVKEKWLKAQMCFLDESFAASTQDALWNGYFVDQGNRTFFLIDSSRGKFCTGPYP